MKGKLLQLLSVIVISVTLNSCSKKGSSIRIVVNNPELNIKSGIRIYLTDNRRTLQGPAYPWERWLNPSYTFKELEPVEKNVFQIKDIERGTYYITVAANVENESFAYGGLIENVQVDKDEVEVEIELSQVRRSFSFQEE